MYQKYIPGAKYKWIPKKEYENKQYARSTKEKAMENLKRRLKKRIKWYKYFREACEDGLNIINNLKEIP